MAELSEKYGADKIQAQLIVGDGGVFDVDLDGERIFSKKATGRFPTYGEVPMAIDVKLINR